MVFSTICYQQIMGRSGQFYHILTLLYHLSLTQLLPCRITCGGWSAPFHNLCSMTILQHHTEHLRLFLMFRRKSFIIINFRCKSYTNSRTRITMCFNEILHYISLAGGVAMHRSSSCFCTHWAGIPVFSIVVLVRTQLGQSKGPAMMLFQKLIWAQQNTCDGQIKYIIY